MKHSAVRATTASAASAGGERRDHELGDGANGADEPGFLKKGLEGRTRQQKPLTRILAGAPVDPAAHGTDVSCGQGGFPSGRVDLAGHAGGQDESFRSGGAGVQADPWAGGGGLSHEWLQGCGGGQGGHEAAGGAGGAAGAGVAVLRAGPRSSRWRGCMVTKGLPVCVTGAHGSPRLSRVDGELIASLAISQRWLGSHISDPHSR